MFYLMIDILNNPMAPVAQKPRGSGLPGFRGRCHGGSDRLNRQAVSRLDQNGQKGSAEHRVGGVLMGYWI